MVGLRPRASVCFIFINYYIEWSRPKEAEGGGEDKSRGLCSSNHYGLFFPRVPPIASAPAALIFCNLFPTRPWTSVQRCFSFLFRGNPCASCATIDVTLGRSDFALFGNCSFLFAPIRRRKTKPLSSLSLPSFFHSSPPFSSLFSSFHERSIRNCYCTNGSVDPRLCSSVVLIVGKNRLRGNLVPGMVCSNPL